MSMRGPAKRPHPQITLALHAPPLFIPFQLDITKGCLFLALIPPIYPTLANLPSGYFENTIADFGITR